MDGPVSAGPSFRVVVGVCLIDDEHLACQPEYPQGVVLRRQRLGDRYQRRGLFGTTAAEAARGQSLEQRLAEEEPDPIGAAHESLDGATTVMSGAILPRR